MIFCVEDDDSIRQLMLYAINGQGFQAKGFSNAAAFWKEMNDTIPDLIILDIMLPDEDGISILMKIRSQPYTMDIPVIMATAKGAEYDKVIALDLGADDYLTKPFGMLEMVSRIRSVLRRTKIQAQPKVLQSGGLTLDEISHEVRIKGVTVELTLKEFDLLRLFLKNPETVFTRDVLLNTVWDNGFTGETRTVDVHIASLRTKIGSEGNNIKTVRGVGYRWAQNK